MQHVALTQGYRFRYLAPCENEGRKNGGLNITRFFPCFLALTSRFSVSFARFGVSEDPSSFCFIHPFLSALFVHILLAEPQEKTPQQVLAEGMVNVRDIVAPSAIEVDFSSLRIGNKYYKTLFVAGYPRFIGANWLSPIINFNHSLDISFFYYLCIAC